MRPLPENSDRIISGWRPEMDVKARGLLLGWVGPFEPDEWTLLGGAYYTPSREPLSEARQALREEWAPYFKRAQERVDLCQERWDAVLADSLREMAADQVIGWIGKDEGDSLEVRHQLNQAVSELGTLRNEFTARDRKIISDETPRRAPEPPRTVGPRRAVRRSRGWARGFTL